MPDVIERDNIRQPPHYHPDGPPQVLTSDTARQAPPGRRILWVMATGLIGAIVFCAIAYLAVLYSR